MDPNCPEWDPNTFVSYYQNSLCNLQTTNNELLQEILRENHASKFFMDRSISMLSTHGNASGEAEYASIDEFRAEVSLTTYEDYRDYIDRMTVEGENNLLCSENITYYATTSGTTGKTKFLPVTVTTMEKRSSLLKIASAIIWGSLPSSSFPSPGQRAFSLLGGKNRELYPRTKDGIPYGLLSQYYSAVPTFPRTVSLPSSNNTLTLDIIERITDFDTSVFIQLVFALAHPNIISYTVIFAPGFVHTIKMIGNYFEEMSLCISSANFDQSSLLQKNIFDTDFRATLNRLLNEVITEYGGETYRLERAQHIRNECLKKKVPGILQRLWPTLVFAQTAIGSTFSMYKEEIQFYCGEQLPLINIFAYASSECFFGTIASIKTDEYILLPTHAFFEFIKEEDVQQAQPKTLLISEIEPGHRYEVVCTTKTGLVRYRMGDMINCTRFLCRSNDLVPLPEEPAEIPRIPLISLAYRVGNLLDIYSEKTNEQHIMNALQKTINQWKQQGIGVDMCDFTSYPRLDVFPPRYVIFLELIEDPERKIDTQQLRVIQNTVNSEVEKQLCEENQYYEVTRRATKLDPLDCILVQSGTFSTFLQKFLYATRPSPLQTKPHRLLKNEQHIRFFQDSQIDISSF